MSRPFCSDAFWDDDLTWNTEWPDFTSCFENTALIYTPNLLLAFVSPFYILYLTRSQRWSEPLPLTRLGGIRTVLSLILAFICLMQIFRTVSEEVSGLDPDISLFIAPWVQTLTLLWSGFLMKFERSHGVINSAPMFVYWVFMAVCGLPQLYSYAISPATSDVYRVVVYCVYYALVIAQLVLSCLIDALPSELVNDKKHCPERSATFLSMLTFHWLTKVCWAGFKKPLTQDDMYKLHPRDMSETVVPKLEEAWAVEVAKAKQVKKQFVHSGTYGATETVTISVDGKQYQPSLMKALIKAFGPENFLGNSYKLVYDVLMFLSPIVLQWMIAYTANNLEPEWHGYAYAVLIFVANLIGSIFYHQCYHITMTSGMTIKSALIGLIYKKSLVMGSQAKKDSTVGEIVNLMSVDTDRINNCVRLLYMLWSAPFQIIVAMVLLWNAMGIAALAGLAVLIALTPINIALARKIKKLQEQQMKYKDKRIRILSEVLFGIKILKLYAWEPSFQQRVNEIREQELILLRRASFINSALNFAWVSAPYLVMLTTFITYIYSTGQPLTPEKAFVALSLFNILRLPLTMLPQILATTAQAVVAVRRIGNFLSHADLDQDNVDRSKSSKSKIALEIRGDGTFSWGAEERPALSDINIKIRRNKLIAIVGPVGSGKSSLLSAMLGDMDKIKGQVTQSGTLSYVAQQAWIQNATIRDNILFGRKFNRIRYEQVIEACALKSDLEILSDGDQTEIGEKGINLSGGQKQRVALARAVYQDRDIILLDDPLSAVDAHVGKHIFDNVVGPNGILSGKTRVIVTHGLHWLPQCDEIIVLADGRITDQGTFQELLSRGGTFADFLREHLADARELDEIMKGELSETAAELLRQLSVESIELHNHRASISSSGMHRFGSVKSLKESLSASIGSSMHESLRSRKSVATTTNVPPAAAKLIEEELSASGGVQWQVMKSFIAALGGFLTFSWLSTFIISQGFGIFGNIWLTQWTSDPILMNVSISNEQVYLDQQSLYLGLYGMSAAGQAIFVLIHSVLYAISCVRASRNVHHNMLDCIMHCAMAFFDTTPTGRILNRFSKDCDTIDNMMPQNFFVFLSMIIQIASTVFIIIYGFPLFAVFVVPLGVFYYVVQRFYIPTTRQLKRIESTTRSPIYNHFSETLSGVSTIRAFGEQNRFIDESLRRVNLNNMSVFTWNSSSRWLGVRLELISNFTVFATCMLAIFYRGSTNSSVVGLSISYALQITQSLTWLVRFTSELESNFVSVERIDEYSRIEGEAPWDSDPKPDKHWPQNGEIVLHNYSTRYRQGLQLVIDGISCSIKPGEKVGIVGRTGAGKSSLTLALFRLIEPAGGKILIDGLDISRLGLHQLRSNLTILPQDPVVFSGSIRYNIDPFSRHSDERLWQALDHAGLRDFVSSCDKGLEHECGENGESLSVGQRQLVCLSRALLNKTKILVLDEATAAVDIETDDQIMKTIKSEFAECTVLTIAHRLHTVMDSNRVLVLDKGHIAEFDSPSALLANPSSIFASMAKSGKTQSKDTDAIDIEM